MPVKKIKFRSTLFGVSFLLDTEINESLIVVFTRIANDAELSSKLTNKPDDLEHIRSNGLDPAKSKFSIFSQDGSRIPINDLNAPIIDQIPPSIKQLDTFELVFAVAGIVAHNLQLKVFTEVVNNFFDRKYDCTLEEAPRYTEKNITPGHHSLVKIKKFPVFGDTANRKSKADILLCLPRHTCHEKKNGALAFDTIQQKHINLWFDRPGLGQGFRHPHVFGCGEPCLNGASIGSMIELFFWFVQTLMLSNVTATSIEVGKLATSIFGKEDFKFNLEAHRSYLKDELGDILLRDEQYIIEYFNECFPQVLDNLR